MLREGKGKLTLNIILGIGVWGLVVVDHLDNLQQILFIQLDQSISQLLHVNGGPLSLLLVLLAGTTVVVARDWAGIAKNRDESLGGVLECDGMLGFVAGSSKVQVVYECGLPAFVARGQINGHVKLTPSLIFASEGGRGKDCGGLVEPKRSCIEGSIPWTGLRKLG